MEARASSVMFKLYKSMSSAAASLRMRDVMLCAVQYVMRRVRVVNMVLRSMVAMLAEERNYEEMSVN